MTEAQKEALKKWLSRQAYSRSSHTVDSDDLKGDWLLLEEMQQYLPDAVDSILKNVKD